MDHMPERPDRDEHREERSASTIAHLAIEGAGTLTPLAAVWLHDKLSDGKEQPKDSSPPPEQKPEPPSE
jgi:hypothetical protein